MLRIRRRISGFLTISALAVIAALAGALLGFSPAQAHTTTAVLFPNGQGTVHGLDQHRAADRRDRDSRLRLRQRLRDHVDGRRTASRSLSPSPAFPTVRRSRPSTSRPTTAATAPPAGHSRRSRGSTAPTRLGDQSHRQRLIPAATWPRRRINVADTVKTSGAGATTLEIGVLKGNATRRPRRSAPRDRAPTTPARRRRRSRHPPTPPRRRTGRRRSTGTRTASTPTTAPPARRPPCSRPATGPTSTWSGDVERRSTRPGLPTARSAANVIEANRPTIASRS